MGKYVRRKSLGLCQAHTHLNWHTHAQWKVLIQPRGWPLCWRFRSEMQGQAPRTFPSFFSMKSRVSSVWHQRASLTSVCCILVSGHVHMQITAVNRHILFNMKMIKYSIPPLLCLSALLHPPPPPPLVSDLSLPLFCLSPSPVLPE